MTKSAPVILCRAIPQPTRYPPGATTDNSSDEDDFGDGSLLVKDSFTEFAVPTGPSSSASLVDGDHKSTTSAPTPEDDGGPSSSSAGGYAGGCPQLDLLLPFVPRLVSEDK